MKITEIIELSAEITRGYWAPVIEEMSERYEDMKKSAESEVA